MFIKIKMQTILIIFSSIILAGIIISPFFWFIYFGNRLILNFFLKISSDAYFFYDDISVDAILVTIFLIIISPFIFTKILKNNINVRNFFISLIISCAIFVSIFLFWAYVLLPQAFSQLHNYF